MIDYHIHTKHSGDTDAEPADYCDRALNLGIPEICFTDHLELDPAKGRAFKGEVALHLHLERRRRSVSGSTSSASPRP